MENITELIESKIKSYNSEFNNAEDIVIYKGYNVIFTKPTMFEDKEYGKYSKKNQNLHIIMNYEVPKEFIFNKSIRKTRTYIGKDIPVDIICGRKFIYVYKPYNTKIKFIDCNVFAFINGYNSKDIIFDNCYIKIYSDYYNRRRYLEHILFNNCTITTKPGIIIQFSSCIFNNCIFTRVKAEMIEFSYSLLSSGDSIINNCTIDKYCKSAIVVPYTSDIITSRLNLINNFIIYITNIKFIYCVDSDDLKNYLSTGKIILKGTRKMSCPQKGSFTGYKFAISTRALEHVDLLLHRIIYGEVPKLDFQSRFNEIIREYGVILKLNIPDDAKRSSGFFNKCRCSKATVISAEPALVLNNMITRDGSEFISLFELGEEIRSFMMTKKNTILYTINSYQKDSYPVVLDKSKLKTRYKMGEEISVDDFDSCRFITCSSGIHFYMSYEEVIKYLKDEVLRR